MSQVKIQLNKVISVSEELNSKTVYLKLSSEDKTFISKIIKQGDQIDWDESFGFELNSVNNQIAILIELWQYESDLADDCDQYLLGSSDIQININEISNNQDRILILTNKNQQNVLEIEVQLQIQRHHNFIEHDMSSSIQKMHLQYETSINIPKQINQQFIQQYNLNLHSPQQMVVSPTRIVTSPIVQTGVLVQSPTSNPYHQSRYNPQLISSQGGQLISSQGGQLISSQGGQLISSQGGQIVQQQYGQVIRQGLSSPTSTTNGRISIGTSLQQPQQQSVFQFPIQQQTMVHSSPINIIQSQHNTVQNGLSSQLNTSYVYNGNMLMNNHNSTPLSSHNNIQLSKPMISTSNHYRTVHNLTNSNVAANSYGLMQSSVTYQTNRFVNNVATNGSKILVNPSLSNNRSIQRSSNVLANNSGIRLSNNNSSNSGVRLSAINQGIMMGNNQGIRISNQGMGISNQGIRISNGSGLRVQQNSGIMSNRLQSTGTNIQSTFSSSLRTLNYR